MYKNNTVGLLGVLCTLLVLISCKPGSPEEKNTYKAQGSAASLSEAEYNSLTALEQYQVANRLLATFFKGVPAQEFFDVSTMTGNEADLRVADGSTGYISNIKDQLNTHLENRQSYYTKVVGDGDIPGRYQFSSEARTPMEYPLAYMYELPLSDEFYARWIAYKLMNTILFSPAEEIDSASPEDADKLFQELSEGIVNHASIRSLIYQHEISETNWRRFRSPEDNTREMIEIYLGLFDRDEDVPKASIACKNWYLTDEDAGYVLKNDPAKNNTEPQLILDNYWVTTCEDVMQAISNHPLVIPRIATVLVDHMFDVGYDSEKKAAFVRSVVGAHPQTFTEMFNAILFSKEFLMNVERPMYFEESFFNTAARIYWTPNSTFFRELAGTSGTGGGMATNLLVMNQPSMSLKLGRWPSVPLDSLGFSYYHRGIRDVALLKRKTNYDNPYNGGYWGWDAKFIGSAVDYLREDAYINYIFISVLGRYATQSELDEINSIITTAKKADGNPEFNPTSTNGGTIVTTRIDIALTVMDYVSRLPELYFYNAVN